ncbi:MAG: hypothetical protein OHK0036_13000 [Bacteroidia bacterium]
MLYYCCAINILDLIRIKQIIDYECNEIIKMVGAFSSRNNVSVISWKFIADIDVCLYFVYNAASCKKILTG